MDERPAGSPPDRGSPAARRAWRTYRCLPAWVQVVVPVVALAAAGTLRAGSDETRLSSVGPAAPASPKVEPAASAPRQATTAGGPATTVRPTTVPPPAAVAGDLPAGEDTTVAEVVDGDTIRVADGRSVRFIGMDTPETKDPRRPVQCFGREASARTQALIPSGSPVRLVYDVERTDRYRRTLAYVYRLPDGLFVNAVLVKEGFAQVATFPPNVAHVDEFVALQHQAREANVGLWGACPASQPAATATTTTATSTAPPPPPAAAPATTTTTPPGTTTTTTAPRTTTTTAPPTTTTGARSPDCHPSYRGTCIPPDVSDADCAGGSGDGPYYVHEKNIQVVGPDEYGLDADKDGIGCEDRSG